MEARVNFETLSTFIFELHKRSQAQDAMTVLQWSVQTLCETVGCDANWGGWADRSKSEVEIYASVTHNLPDDYYRFWSGIKHQDLLAHDVLGTGSDVASYSRQGARHTAGMVALSDRYHIDHMSVVVVDNKNSPASLFLSSYRSGSNARPLEAQEMRYLRAALEHVQFAVECNALGRQGQHDLLVNDAGQVLAASPEVLRTLRECWPAWKGDRLPEAIGGRAAGAQPRIRFEREEAPCFFGPRLFYLKLCRNGPLSQLTAREQEIVCHIAEGQTHKEIARALGISPATVRNHTQAALTKLGARNKAALIAMVNVERSN